ncbi:MAG: hypothetical protein HOQ44_22855 [Nocardia sp.]|nr:hypothetical protein [Nocardia sp.]
MSLRYADLEARFPGLLAVVFRALADMVEDDEKWDGTPADRAKLLGALKQSVRSHPASGASGE